MAKPLDLDAFRSTLSDLRRMMPEIEENTVLMAQITRSKFNALVKAGFTESQAIELCKTHSPLV